MSETIAVLDFGSQYNQLITRRVREVGVYAELFPWDAPADRVLAIKPKGFILSGGPSSVYAEDAPFIKDYILESGCPILGICYGMQAMAQSLGGKVSAAQKREYGPGQIEITTASSLIDTGTQPVWMSHGDRIEALPAGFTTLASSVHSPIAVMADEQRNYYGIQFHPEVRHTPGGMELIRRFVIEICQAKPTWTAESIIQQSVANIRSQVGSERVLAAVSGGVDSSVAAALVYKAVGEQLTAVFVDNGLLRLNERQQVEGAFLRTTGMKVVVIDASTLFLQRLKGISVPDRKRKIIGKTFIEVFFGHAEQIGTPPYLTQGTIYPDVIESSAKDRSKGAQIKPHHNVGGLPKNMPFKLVEPLRYLFKDEVRKVGEALGLPAELVWRQPFPGPGLAIRCLGCVEAARLDRLRLADAIFTRELEENGYFTHELGVLNNSVSQAFAVLLPVRSIGVMGDQRTYHEAIALRAVATDDFMTADWTHLPPELLTRVANRIVNEVPGINRVVYDITTKPPATIEWE